MKDILFISWGNFHQGKEAIANFFGVRSVYIGEKKSKKIYSLFSYPNKILKTLQTVWREKPNGIIVTNTIWLLPATCLILGKILNIKIFFHTHTGGIVNSQLAYPSLFKRWFSRMAALNLVSNENHKNIVEKWGGKASILPDPPVDFKQQKEEKFALSNKINICYINTYSNDEPYEEVVEAFKDIQNVTLYITGNPRNRPVINRDNIVHTGYLSRPQYIYLIKNSDILMALTKRENTFQCGGNEALSLGKPLITSNTTYLRSYFLKGTVHVDIKPSSIKEGVHELIYNIKKYKNEMLNLRSDIVKYFDMIKNELDNSFVSLSK